MLTRPGEKWPKKQETNDFESVEEELYLIIPQYIFHGNGLIFSNRVWINIYC